MAERRLIAPWIAGDRRRLLYCPVDSRLARRAPGTRRYRGRADDSQPDGHRCRRRGRPADLHRLAGQRSDPAEDIQLIASSSFGLEQYRPITIFSGYRPFVGSGFEVANVVVRATSAPHRRGQRDTAVQEPDDNQAAEPDPVSTWEPPFRTLDIVEHIKQSIEFARRRREAELRLPGLQHLRQGVRRRIPHRQAHWQLLTTRRCYDAAIANPAIRTGTTSRAKSSR